MRKIKQLMMIPGTLFALSGDGTAWYKNTGQPWIPIDPLPAPVIETAKGGLCYHSSRGGTQVMVSRDHDPDDRPIAELRCTTRRGWVLWEIAQEDTLSTEEVVAIGAKLQELREEFP